MQIVSARSCTAYLFLLLLTSICSVNSFAQGSASAKLSSGHATSGEEVSADVSLDEPIGPSQTVSLNFVDVQERSNQFQIAEGTQLRVSSIHIVGKIPLDIPSGTYTVSVVTLSPAVGYSKYTTVPMEPPLQLVVTALPSAVAPPSRATASLKLNQKQVFETASADLTLLINELDTRLSKDSLDTPSLTKFLIQTTERADALLLQTKERYAETLSGTAKIPIFFQDFHLHYQAALTEMKSSLTQRTSSMSRQATFVEVQMKVRPKQNPNGPRSLPQSGSSPMRANQTDTLMQDNLAVYKLLPNTGTPLFHIRLASRPAGAAISFRKIDMTSFEPWAQKTNVEDASFEYAYWTFQFAKDGCVTATQRVIPYRDSHPNLEPELNCHAK